jgi:hypothetical protein
MPKLFYKILYHFTQKNFDTLEIFSFKIGFENLFYFVGMLDFYNMRFKRIKKLY